MSNRKSSKKGFLRFVFKKRLSVFKNAKPTDLSFAFFVGNNEEGFCNLHFDGKKRFLHPATKQEVDPRIFLTEVKSVLGVKRLYVSCCYAETAQHLIGDINGVTILTLGKNKEVSSIHRNGDIIQVEM